MKVWFLFDLLHNISEESEKDEIENCGSVLIVYSSSCLALAYGRLQMFPLNRKAFFIIKQIGQLMKHPKFIAFTELAISCWLFMKQIMYFPTSHLT